MFKLMLPAALLVGAAMVAGAPCEPPKKLPPAPAPAPPVAPVAAPGATTVCACTTEKLALTHSAANKWRANDPGKK